MNSFAEFGWERKNTNDSHHNARCGKHCLEKQDENPRLVLYPNIKHIGDPTDTDTVQKEPPKEVDSVLDVTVP